MKTIFYFLLLLSYLNVALLPQLPEVDVYNVNGEQMDDINSVFEWISILIDIDTITDDEDNDNGQNYIIANYFITSCPPLFNVRNYILYFQLLNLKENNFSIYTGIIPFHINLGMETPPPEF